MISLFKFFLQTLPLVIVGFYIGIQFGHWFGEGAHQTMRDFFVSMENYISYAVMTGVNWVSTKFGGS